MHQTLKFGFFTFDKGTLNILLKKLTSMKDIYQGSNERTT